MNPAPSMTKFSYQVQLFKVFSKIDAKAYVRSHLSVFLLSYRTKYVALVLILQSYYHIFIELKNIDRNSVKLTWIWEISLFLKW